MIQRTASPLIPAFSRSGEKEARPAFVGQRARVGREPNALDHHPLSTAPFLHSSVTPTLSLPTGGIWFSKLGGPVLMINVSYLLFVASLLAMPNCIRAAELTKVNVHHMQPGPCLAGSRVDEQAIGGFGASDNAPQKVRAGDAGRDGQLALIAFPHQVVPLARKQQGMKLRLVNRTRNEAAFPASDSRLSIVQEAKNAKGSWQPIEYLPSSWCGNSCHRVFLPAGHYWEFAVPFYAGAMKTKLRFVLQGKPSLYSNEFEGSINPEQFTRRLDRPKTDRSR